MDKKFLRFIQLSEKFSKNESDLFGEDYKYLSGNTLTLGDGIFWGQTGIKDTPIPRTKFIEEELKNRVQLSKDYDEYLELQRELKKYFESKIKLEGNE